MRSRRATLLLLFLLLLSGNLHSQPEPSNADQLRRAFAHPPDDARIMMRWWWFGPAVTESELARELGQMKADGIGGVEIATIYPLALNDRATGFHNAPYLSPEHLQALRFAAAEARRLGMRVDITLGSGWPFGGPAIPIDQAAGQLRVVATPITSQSSSLAVPEIDQGESLLAVFFAPGTGSSLSWKNAKQAPLPSGAFVPVPANLSLPGTAAFFISSRTGMEVKRAAVGAEGFVLDHYDRNAIATHLQSVADPLIGAFGDHPPYAAFSDSLEVYGSDWTPRLLEEFRKRRGYDLTPCLPALVGDIGPKTQAVRHDWGKTLTELANEDYLAPLQAWAHAHHAEFRSQSYGTPPVNLWSNSLADLPEGEGKSSVTMWRQFSDTRWAASASHLLGKPVTSSETWTWLHSPPFRATPLDMKAEADLHFLQGINQLIGHGWPYSPQSAGDPGWHMYAAAAFNDHNPWHFVMPEVTAYLQRVSYALRLGKPANQVALLLPEDDAWAAFSAGASSPRSLTTSAGFNMSGIRVSMDESLAPLLGSTIIPQILDAGFNLDFIDADAIDAVGIPYPVLILPGIHRLPLATYRRIQDYVRRGGIVIATRSLPDEAPGLLEADRETPQIRQISSSLFQSPGARGHFIPQEDRLAAALPTWIKPDLTLSPATPEVGFIHRKLPDGDIYFLANTSNRPRQFTARFAASRHSAEFWDPFTGAATPIDHPQSISLSLQPYESRIVFFSNEVLPPQPRLPAAGPSRAVDLAANWTVTFAGTSRTLHPADLRSWTTDPQLVFYSGQATYQNTFHLPAPTNRPPRSVVLDFGPGTPVEPNPAPGEFNMRAYLESPVREAAEVFVNGQRAGSIWHPPYTLDLTRFVRSGDNALRIVVGNTAINRMAGQPLPDYRLLNDRYGVRFVPQGRNGIHPLPSGILHAPKLIVTPAATATP